MASDKDQETDHKTRKETRKTSLLLQTDSGGRTNNQPNISSIQWKLRRSNRIPKGNPTRICLIISGHHRNQTLIPSPQRQREYSRHNPKRVAITPITDRGCNK